MIPIDCELAQALLEQGWEEGLGGADFRRIAVHLADCSDCASKVRAWARTDASLAELAKAFSQAAPGTSIAGRVHEAILRERPSFGDDSNAVAEIDLGRFLERLRHDAGLRKRLAQAADRDALLELLVCLGREQGLAFSMATLRGALETRQAANDGELTDQQLEAVAGGSSEQFALLQELLDGLPPGGRPH